MAGIRVSSECVLWDVITHSLYTAVTPSEGGISCYESGRQKVGSQCPKNVSPRQGHGDLRGHPRQKNCRPREVIVSGRSCH